MAIGLVGRKCGMTRIFTPEGRSIPVTVIEIEPNRITQVKTLENDGYSAIQVTTGTRRASRVTAPMAGHFAKAGTGAGRIVCEFRLESAETTDLTAGAELKVDYFAVGQEVDVTGTTKGRGFSGVVRRHNFRTQDATHGNSVSHRAPGSIGQRQTPGRVFKGKRMAGHYGATRVTIQTQEVIRVDAERGLLLVKGGVPGAVNGNVIVRPAMKSKAKGV